MKACTKFVAPVLQPELVDAANVTTAKFVVTDGWAAVAAFHVSRLLASTTRAYEPVEVGSPDSTLACVAPATALVDSPTYSVLLKNPGAGAASVPMFKIMSPAVIISPIDCEGMVNAAGEAVTLGAANRCGFVYWFCVAPVPGLPTKNNVVPEGVAESQVVVAPPLAKVPAVIE